MDILKTLPRQSRFKLPASARRRTGVETKVPSPMAHLSLLYLLGGGGWRGEPGACLFCALLFYDL